MRDRIDLSGAVDLHTHVGPSPFDRRVDGYECAIEAAAAGMDAVVMKEHHLPTVYAEPYIDRLLDRDGTDIEMLGSVVLNYCNGGFNPFVVEAAIQYGARVVWGPTIDARHHAEQTGSLGAFLGVDAGREYDGRDGIYALEDDGTLRPEVCLCLDKVVDGDLLFCLGHLSFEETREVVTYLTERGHDRVVIDHPNYHVTDLDLDQQRELVDLGATLNFPFMAISPKYHWISSADLAENIRDVGVENCVVSSDVGQLVNPSVPESLRILGETLLEEGFAPAEFEQLVETKPKELLGLG
ncbi:DUF6282 family protein [Haloarchaeobius sp. HRN-SO-5]|uniref:DUF6282 family protein n=1 Tax=Haloarchaeobius sp. HRN-SO-5 TaxID=3446118 RepID=UPI003EB779D1